MDEKYAKFNDDNYPILIDQESENIVKRQKEYIESRKLDFDEYLKNSEKTYEGLLEESREVAQKNINRSLVINEISVKEDINVDEEEFVKEVQSQSHPGIEHV